MSSTVFITGGTGYIAKHIIMQLLHKNYLVITTVRSKAKGESLLRQFNNSSLSYVIIEDISVANCFDLIVNYPQISIFIHTAMKLPANGENPPVEELVSLAVNGTKNALNAISKFGAGVRHFVLTSSVSAVYPMHKQLPIYDETSWNDVTMEDALKMQHPVVSYNLAKTLAEKAAWDYVKQKDCCFKLTTILPNLVFGPQAFDSDIRETLNVSAEVINSIILKKPLSMPGLTTASFIDVRDVAKAHIVAFEKVIANERLILSEDEFTIHDIIQMINLQYPDLNLPQVDQVEKIRDINNDKSRQLLDFTFIKLKQTVLESSKQIIDNQKLLST